MDKKKKISVVLSFYNEEDVLGELVRRLRNVFSVDLKGIIEDYELIFVNDASTDRSEQILLDLAKDKRDIKIINMSRNFGIFPCVLAGMKYSSGSAVIYMDSDLQDPPELIPTLIEKWREGADIVYTTRISRAGENALKMLITKWAYRVLNFFSGITLPVDSGDFKLLDRRVISELLKLKEKDPYLRGLISWLGFKQTQVLYHREKRFAGKTHFALYKSLNPLKAFISGLTSFSLVPLSISLILGFFVSFGAFVYLIAVIIMKFLGMNLPGWSAIMVTLLFLGGVQLFTIGILGLYVGRIYNESKDRPNYIIESMIGFDTKE